MIDLISALCRAWFVIFAAQVIISRETFLQGQRVNVLIGADTWVVGVIVGFVALTSAVIHCPIARHKKIRLIASHKQVTGRGYKIEVKSIEGTTEATVPEEAVMRRPGK